MRGGLQAEGEMEMTNQFSVRKWILFTFIWASMFLSACDPAGSTPPTATPVPTCVSSTPNPFESYDSKETIRIYTDYVNGAIGLENARKEAFIRLGGIVRERSAYNDLARDDGRMMRITVTLIDPVLMQYVYLNQALMEAATTPMEPLDQFDSGMRRVMDGFSRRKELLFLVTITSTEYISQPYGSRLLTAQIPFERMVLINASDMNMTSTHDDHNLSELIPVNGGPVHGYVAFPLSVRDKDENCVSIMDLWNTTLTLEIPSARLGDKDFGAQSWTLPYFPLVERNEAQTYSVDKYPLINVEDIQTSPTPPPPVWNPNSASDSNDWDNYWRNMGRFLWSILMMNGYH